MGSEVIELICHPQTPASNVEGISCIFDLDRGDGDMILWFIVRGDPESIVIPASAKPYRTDGLWRSTCFELFVKTGPESYLEMNFSPSSQWALYGFESYRMGMTSLPVDAPPSAHCWTYPEDRVFGMTCVPRLKGLVDRAVALSAVIEETDGTKSYWAIAHPPGKPDFHHATCFAAALPAPR